MAFVFVQSVEFATSGLQSCSTGLEFHFKIVRNKVVSESFLIGKSSGHWAFRLLDITTVMQTDVLSSQGLFIYKFLTNEGFVYILISHTWFTQKLLLAHCCYGYILVGVNSHSRQKTVGCKILFFHVNHSYCSLFIVVIVKVNAMHPHVC